MPEETQSLQSEDTTTLSAPAVADPAENIALVITPLPEQEVKTTTSSSTFVWPPPARKHRRRSGLSRVAIVATFILVALLILAGMGFIAFSTTIQYQSSLHHEATAEVQLTKNIVGTTQANARGTSQALNSAQSAIDATATEQANTSAQATTTIDNATATASAFGDTYTTATDGTPIFDDALSDNTGSGGWVTGMPSTNTGCTFTDGSYHASEAQQNYIQPCVAQNTHFGSFTYQVHITIDKGNPGQAGLLFRTSNDAQSFYFFSISSYGSYELDLYQSNNQSSLAKGSNPAIQAGIGQSNEIAVIADSNTLTLFANGQYLTSVTDTTLSTGKIGVAVVNNGTPIEAEFSDAQLWPIQSPSDAQASPTPDASSTPQDSATPTDTPGA